MSEDWHIRARIRAKLRAGRPNEADALQEDANVEEKFHELADAAMRAGRLKDFEESWTHFQRSIKADRLGTRVSRDQMLDYLTPFAMSDPAYVRRKHPNLPDEAVWRAVQKAQSETFDSRRRAIDQFLDGARLAALQAGEAGRKRATIDASQRDPARVQPLLEDGKGRFGKVRGYRRNSPAGRVGRSLSRVWRSLGGTTPDRNVLTAEDAALRDLRDRYGIQIITPEREARLRAKRSLPRRMTSAALAPPATLWGSVKTSALLGAKTWRLRRLERAAGREEDPTTRRALLARAEELRRTLPTTDAASPRAILVRFWRAASLGLRVRLVLMGLLLLTALAYIGWFGTLAMAMQAFYVLITTLANLFLGALNGILWFLGGLFYIAANAGLAVANALLGVLYDAVWKSIGQFVPGANYAKPYFEFGSLAVPQLSYLLSVFTHITIDPETGERTIGLPEIYYADADGRLTHGLFWTNDGRAGLQFPTIRLMTRTCDGAHATSHCQDFWSYARTAGEGWIKNFYCTLRDADSVCQQEVPA